MLVFLRYYNAFLGFQGLGEVLPLSVIGQKMEKKLVLASPSLIQVSLDFCLALLFSIAARPKSLSFKVLTSIISFLERFLDSCAFSSYSITSLQISIAILLCDLMVFAQDLSVFAVLESLI
jgi:hypothetical protein